MWSSNSRFLTFHAFKRWKIIVWYTEEKYLRRDIISETILFGIVKYGYRVIHFVVDCVFFVKNMNLLYVSILLLPMNIHQARPGFLSPRAKLSEIKKKRPVPYEKSDCITFRGKKTSSLRKSNPWVRNEQYLYLFYYSVSNRFYHSSIKRMRDDFFWSWIFYARRQILSRTEFHRISNFCDFIF